MLPLKQGLTACLPRGGHSVPLPKSRNQFSIRFPARESAIPGRSHHAESVNEVSPGRGNQLSRITGNRYWRVKQHSLMRIDAGQWRCGLSRLVSATTGASRNVAISLQKGKLLVAFSRGALGRDRGTLPPRRRPAAAGCVPPDAVPLRELAHLGADP